MKECQTPRYPMRIGFQHRTIVSTAAAPVDHSYRQVATCISVRPVRHFDPPIMTSPFFFLTGRDSPQRNHRLRHSNPTQPNRTRYDWKWMAIFFGEGIIFSVFIFGICFWFLFPCFFCFRLFASLLFFLSHFSASLLFCFFACLLLDCSASLLFAAFLLLKPK